jgi:cytoskeletal protein CcmA (bactofilin family)
VSAGAAILILLLAVAALVSLPLLPGLREFLRPTDTRALKVVPEAAVSVRHFARTFRTMIDTHLGPALARANSEGLDVLTTLPDGSLCWCMPPDASPPEAPQLPEGKEVGELLLAGAGNLRLPEGAVLPREIFAAGDLLVGAHSSLRAALCAGDIELGREVSVARWLHAGGTLRAGVGCQLHGRASADQAIVLAWDCRFERLHAPEIRFGEWHPQKPSATTHQQLDPEHLPGLIDYSAGRALVRGDLTLSSETEITADIVATGSLHIAAGAIVHGNVKARRDVRLAAGCHLNGAATAGRDLIAGEGCLITGPLIAEGDVELAAGCRVGTAEKLTTITAEGIRIAPGTLVHGTVWGRKS